MYYASVNKRNLEIVQDGQDFLINGKPFQWDLVKISEGYFHILYNNRSYKAELVKADSTNKTFHIKVNGTIYPVNVKDKFDMLLEKMGMTSNAAGKINSIKAPMPGLIIDLKVSEGTKVNAGDPLLILEAMKMENIIKSSGEGIVKKVKVKKGESVEKNQVLIEF